MTEAEIPTRPAAPQLSPARTTAAIIALAMGGFGIGVTEFAAMGLLRSIAEGFAATEAQAGVAISAYALGVVVGAPLITVAAARMPRKTLLLVLMALFTVGNTAAAFSPNLPVLIATRFVAGIPHGAYFGAACVVAATLAGPGREAKATSYVILGLSVANVVGVPAATRLGDSIGWQWAFAAVGLIGLATFAAIALAVPHPRGLEPVSVRDELSALRQSQVLLTLAVAAIGFGGLFAIYSYIQWTMVDVAGVPRETMPWVLALYGIGMVVGGLLGGIAADRDLERTLLGGLVVMAALMFGFFLATPWLAPAVVGVFLVGLGGSFVIPALQTRLMRWAGRGQTLAGALNHAALNVANALGAWVGGLVIAAGFGYRAPAVAAVALAVVGLAIAVPAVIKGKRTAPPTRRATPVV